MSTVLERRTSRFEHLEKISLIFFNFVTRFQSSTYITILVPLCMVYHYHYLSGSRYSVIRHVCILPLPLLPYLELPQWKHVSFMKYWARLACRSCSRRIATQFERVLWIVHRKSMQCSFLHLYISLFNFAVRRNKQHGHVSNRHTKKVGEFSERGS